MTKRQPKQAAPAPLISADLTPPCLYLRLRLASQRLRALYEAHLAPSGVSMPQFGLLTGIHEELDLTMSRLAEKRELSPSTLTRNLRPLQEVGWIEILVDPSNRRVRRLRLTKEGRARLRTAYGCWKQAQAEAEAIVSPRAVTQILRATETLPR